MKWFSLSCWIISAIFLRSVTHIDTIRHWQNHEDLCIIQQFFFSFEARVKKVRIYYWMLSDHILCAIVIWHTLASVVFSFFPSYFFLKSVININQVNTMVHCLHYMPNNFVLWCKVVFFTSSFFRFVLMLFISRYFSFVALAVWWSYNEALKFIGIVSRQLKRATLFNKNVY